MPFSSEDIWRGARERYNYTNPFVSHGEKPSVKFTDVGRSETTKSYPATYRRLRTFRRAVGGMNGLPRRSGFIWRGATASNWHTNTLVSES